MSSTCYTILLFPIILFYLLLILWNPHLLTHFYYTCASSPLSGTCNENNVRSASESTVFSNAQIQMQSVWLLQGVCVWCFHYICECARCMSVTNIHDNTRSTEILLPDRTLSDTMTRRALFSMGKTEDAFRSGLLPIGGGKSLRSSGCSPAIPE